MAEFNDEILIYNTDDGKADVKLYSKDGVIWMNQQQMALLFDTSKQNISLHVVNVLQDKELDEKSVVKDYLTTASDGKKYNVTYYALPMVLAVGFRVRSIRGTQFRKWANKNLTEFLQKGFVMDDERLKNPDGRPDYFDELLGRIRDIRASEKRFYQKVRDLFSLSSDYEHDKMELAKSEMKFGNMNYYLKKAEYLKKHCWKTAEDVRADIIEAMKSQIRG